MEYKVTDHNISDVEMLLSKFIDESVFDGFVSKDGIKKILENKNFFTIVAYKIKPVGIFIGVKYEHPIFKGALLCDDLLMFVDKDNRGGMTAARFVKMYESWAKSIGVKYVRLGNSTGIGNIEKVSKFYEGMGFKRVGFNTLKEI